MHPEHKTETEVIKWAEQVYGKPETVTQITIQKIVVDAILHWEETNGR